VTRSWKRAVVDVVAISLIVQSTLTRVVVVSHACKDKPTVVVVVSIKA